MPNTTDTGFLLRKFPYSESSLILKACTREHGIVSFMAKGARRQTSRLHGLLEPALHLQFLFPARSRGEIRVLADVALLRDFPAVRDDLVRQALGQVFGEVLLKYLPDGARAPDFHDALLSAMERLEDSGNGSPSLQTRFAAFVLDFCRLSGFQPQFRFCVRCDARVAGPTVDFPVDRGGPVCGRCRSGEEGALRIREGTLRWLDAVQSGEEPPGLGMADAARAGEFLLLYLGRHAGGQKLLKSVAVWRNLMEDGLRT